MRKIRRKLFSNEKQRLQQRRLALQNREYDGYDAAVDTTAREYDGVVVNIDNRVDQDYSTNGDSIERDETKKPEAYDQAIEKLKSISKMKTKHVKFHYPNIFSQTEASSSSRGSS